MVWLLRFGALQVARLPGLALRGNGSARLRLQRGNAFALVELWVVFGLNVLKRFGLNCVWTREGESGAIPLLSHRYLQHIILYSGTFIPKSVSLLRWYVLSCE